MTNTFFSFHCLKNLNIDVSENVRKLTSIALETNFIDFARFTGVNEGNIKSRLKISLYRFIYTSSLKDTITLPEKKAKKQIILKYRYRFSVKMTNQYIYHMVKFFFFHLMTDGNQSHIWISREIEREREIPSF